MLNYQRVRITWILVTWIIIVSAELLPRGTKLRMVHVSTALFDAYVDTDFG